MSAAITLRMPALDRTNAAIRNVSLAARRGVEASIAGHQRHAIKRHVTGRFPPYWKQRTTALRRSIGRSMKRWRLTGQGDAFRGAFGYTGIYAHALEFGGSYIQTVKAHHRERVKLTRSQVAAIRLKTGKYQKPGTGPVAVRRYRRNRREEARYIVGQTIAELRSVRTKPVEAAMRIILQDGRLPRRSELIRAMGA